MSDAPRVKRSVWQGDTYFSIDPRGGSRWEVFAVHRVVDLDPGKHAVRTVSWFQIGSVTPDQARAFARAILAIADAVDGDGREL